MAEEGNPLTEGQNKVNKPQQTKKLPTGDGAAAPKNKRKRRKKPQKTLAGEAKPFVGKQVAQAQIGQAPIPAIPQKKKRKRKKKPKISSQVRPQTAMPVVEQPAVAPVVEQAVEPVLEPINQPVTEPVFESTAITGQENQPVIETVADIPAEPLVQLEPVVEVAAEPLSQLESVAEQAWGQESQVQTQAEESPFQVSSQASPFDTATVQPVEQANSSPFDQSFQPQAEVSPFDTSAQPQQPINPFESSAAESPFDQNSAQDFSQQQPSPFDAGYDTASQDQTFDTQSFAAESQPGMTGDPMKDIPIFPDNFGTEPELQTETQSEVISQAEPIAVPEPEKPDDFFSTMAYGGSPFDKGEVAEQPQTPEPIEAEVISSSSEIAPSAADNNQFALPGEQSTAKEGKSFWQTLQESGISKGFVVKSCAGLLILIAVVTFLSLGGLGIIQNWFSADGQVEEPKPAEEPSEEPSREPAASINNAVVFGKNAGAKFSFTLPTPLRMAQLFGKEFVPLAPGYWRATLDNTTVFGAPTLKDRLEGDYRVVTAIDLLRRMVNAYQVDIHSTLNRAVSREQALDDYLQLLNELYEEAKEMRAMLTQELSVIKTSFDALAQPKTDMENIFFSNIEQMMAADAAKNLRSFIEYSQELVSLRARYKALQRIDEKFVNFLQQFRARLQDLQDNRDALLKGVKVYDVPRSDLDLIIPVELKDLDTI